MRNLIAVFCVILAVDPPSVFSITDGQRISILRVPFFALIEGKHEDGSLALGGAVIVHEKFVITENKIVLFEDTRVRVDAARRQDQTTFKVRRYERNDLIALVEIYGEFIFGPRIQKAILPKFRIKRFPLKKMFYVAGMGNTNTDNPWTYVDELYGRPVFVSYEDMSDEDSKHMFLMSDSDNGPVILNAGDIGGPVWDLDTGDVVALILAPRSYKDCTLAIKLAPQRPWISNNIKKLS